jgi:hypothetical protein
VVDVPLFIDSLWIKQADDNLVVGLTGAIGFHAEFGDCEAKLIYTARYYPDGMTDDYQTKSLTDLVDVGTWEISTSDNISTTYVDSSYKYVVYHTSDDIYMGIFDK